MDLYAARQSFVCVSITITASGDANDAPAALFADPPAAADSPIVSSPRTPEVTTPFLDVHVTTSIAAETVRVGTFAWPELLLCVHVPSHADMGECVCVLSCARAFVRRLCPTTLFV